VLLWVVAVLCAACGGGSESADPPAELTNATTEAPPLEPTEPDPAVMDHFRAFSDLELTIDGSQVPIFESGVGYHRGSIDSFDDPSTVGHDGIAKTIQAFLACETHAWSIGSQTFTVNAIAQGAMTDDADLIEKGARGIDWALGLTVLSDGVHQLDRDCDTEGPIPDNGGTHHSAQWLETLGQAVYWLFLTDDPELYRDRIESYVSRSETIANRQSDEENLAFWKDRWVIEDDGNVFTHKSYMMAAGLGLAASLTDDSKAAQRWRSEAAEIARFGLEQQRPNGVNPERGDHDVIYQMYGVSLAQLYYASLADDAPLKVELAEMIDQAIGWSAGRIDPQTGQVDITGSTRTCVTTDDSTAYFTADLVRVFLIWASLHEERTDLSDQAVLADTGGRASGNPCPD
jgi:hypothetical protein